jgi:hypothetical protein
MKKLQESSLYLPLIPVQQNLRLVPVMLLEPDFQQLSLKQALVIPELGLLLTMLH